MAGSSVQLTTLPAVTHRRQIMITSPGSVTVTQVPVEPLGPHQVLAATVVSGISAGTEMGWWHGAAPAMHRRWVPEQRIFLEEPGRQLPIAPGYESVARIVACGHAATGVRPGDLVAVDRPHADWHVLDCATAAAGRLSEPVTAEQALFFVLARVALGAVHDTDLALGDTVVVMGLGVVGLLAAQQAKLAGARVIGVDRYRLRTQAAARRGIEIILAAPGVDVAVAVRDLVGPAGADAAIEASGSYLGLHEAIRCVRAAGQVTTAGSYHGGQDGLRMGEEYHRNRINVVSSMTVNGCPSRRYPRWDKERLDRTARSLIASGQVPVDDLITHWVPFADAAAAYALLAERPEETIKVALTYDQP